MGVLPLPWDKKKFSPAKSRQQAQEDDETEEKSKRSSQPKVTPLHRTVTKKMPGTGREVCVIKPTSVEDARDHGDTAGQPDSGT